MSAQISYLFLNVSTAKHFCTQKYKIILWYQTKSVHVVYVQVYVIVSFTSKKIATIFVLANWMLCTTKKVIQVNNTTTKWWPEIPID